jgi:hypothetical protein
MKQNNRKSFVNTDEWLEAFQMEPSKEMRFGMLDALLNTKNFEDQRGLSKRAARNTLTGVYLQAIKFAIEQDYKATV